MRIGTEVPEGAAISCATNIQQSFGCLLVPPGDCGRAICQIITGLSCLVDGSYIQREDLEIIEEFCRSNKNG